MEGLHDCVQYGELGRLRDWIGQQASEEVRKVVAPGSADVSDHV